MTVKEQRRAQVLLRACPLWWVLVGAIPLKEAAVVRPACPVGRLYQGTYQGVRGDVPPNK